LDLKQLVVGKLRDWQYEVQDFGVQGPDSVDYPDYALLVARAVAEGRADRGVLVCGTGIGMSIAANKVAGIRAALASDEFSARMAREHNDANVLCLGGRVLGPDRALAILGAWLEARFEGGRHQRRIDKIHAAETVR
jgi:ribose 5-phosphate isomerase B